MKITEVSGDTALQLLPGNIPVKSGRVFGGIISPPIAIAPFMTYLIDYTQRKVVCEKARL
jgi:hypothetical protein